MKKPPLHEILTTKEVAGYLRLSTEGVRLLVRKGELRPWRRSSQGWLFRGEVVRAMEQERARLRQGLRSQRPTTDLLTASEAADVLGVSSQLVRILAKRGDITCDWVSRGWRVFRRADVQALAEQRRRNGLKVRPKIEGGMQQHPAS